MKVKTSLTLSRDVLSAIDRPAGSKHSRSAFIEAILHRYLQGGHGLTVISAIWKYLTGTGTN